MKMELKSPSLQLNILKRVPLQWKEHRHLPRFSQPLSSFLSQWRNQAETIGNYFAIYGGFPALLKSPYLHIAFVLSVVCEWFWPVKDGARVGSANEIAISVLPNLLGFTVGALAIVLAFSSAEVFVTIAEEGRPKSFFMKLTANLVHFIFVQVLALSIGIVAKILGSQVLDYFSLFSLFYAVLIVFSAAMQLYQTAIIYNMRASLLKDDETQEGTQTDRSV